ncbi:MAG: DUF7130 family rubredoxin-like protein [Halobacteriota archaeon]|uniref:DUF7130 family rubredoxin-like protein n=1 Tax=Natronomonas sp. TaxID=2184060 RepID=UPI003974E18F
MDDENEIHGASIEPGEVVYDSNGRPVGRVSGLTDDGFEAEAMGLHENEAQELPGQEFGEGYLMWRCVECGEMGELDEGLPEVCPNCSAPREAISTVRED